MKWKLREPSRFIAALNGRYTFKLVKGSHTDPSKPQTTVLYQLTVDPAIPFPKFVKTVINKAVASQALKELKRYTEKQRKIRLKAEGGGCEASPKKSSWLFACFGF
jgi:hypothetical protein